MYGKADYGHYASPGYSRILQKIFICVPMEIKAHSSTSEIGYRTGYQMVT